MLLFNKSKDKLSSRRQIQIKEVKDGILVLPNHEYRVVIETSSINFELKSDEEQDVLIDGFQNFLNSLPSQLQVLVRVREVDIDGYLEKISKSKQTEKERVYKDQIDNYSEFIKDLVAGNKILSRKFFVVIPYKHIDSNKDFNLIKEQIHLSRDIVLRGLEKLGIKAKVLDSIELIRLFYSSYNPSQLKTQELSAHTIGEVLKGIHA
ncbi:hypothetical protein A2631_02260 [Candidatus Daviesbacteria bacterium RIFCSPHIGHO2_01_FULL_44_29]|uniref:Uncharacterized protein n=1 Tax=Candidatus Daviesbacteria bacterium RIFCSPHIGHO2_02_FULL_43_12 TaxID=1797776 RepID=A0A1F5KJV3_9BACT|nr:MAG: hypothetical protein A2631_02260 [Candidatus Daviesbacteria bacterium RIFCSPHIGHO2_01_FULL_44_29]OGE40999.1 MAG: hypothetical protein A3E86_03695 [Candidatus Daviesbacteria bacterium RIFCSPHIGHO2_12_FULL_47_45]OGE41216.1 MAG: hypothetical protein A3D25_01655 [Candidatus Daviesbacteria bacterium RIFCSPHIGHO2_02_FULL_43_12]OGE69416.1 MAG: hypothetical protein A3B55_03395 [Candidatus Daviesbacteria bacterium RIFCSPLOWO2_01_FULL_43_15]